jgi:hypothetical protein
MELIIPKILTMPHYCQDNMARMVKNEKEKGRRGEWEKRRY